MKSFEYIVEDPIEIQGLVEELHLEAEDKVTSIFLDHQEEPNIVRGYGQPLLHKQKPDIPEIRRGDGGLSWYHLDNFTKCFMIGVPSEDSKNNREITRAWGNLLVNELKELGYSAELEHPDKNTDFDGFRGPDIYDTESGGQLVGLSASQTDSSSVLRACWYEDDLEEVASESFEKLLEADNISPSVFYDSVEPLEDFYNHLTSKLNPETVYSDFVSEDAFNAVKDYNEREEGYVHGACVLD